MTFIKFWFYILHQSSNIPAWIILILHFNLNVSRAKVGHDFSIMFETDLNLLKYWHRLWLVTTTSCWISIDGLNLFPWKVSQTKISVQKFPIFFFLSLQKISTYFIFPFPYVTCTKAIRKSRFGNVRNVNKSTLWYAPLMRWKLNLKKLHSGISSRQLPKQPKC